MLKQGLELKQQQKLSPLQIQTIKLIELPIQELEQRIRKELEENPVLDEEQRRMRKMLQERYLCRTIRMMIRFRATDSVQIIIQRMNVLSTVPFL